MKTTTIQLIDLTIREGGFRVHHRMLPEHVGDIIGGLGSAGFSFAEVSHGCSIGSFRIGYPGLCTDEDLLRAARRAAPGMEFSVYIYPSPHNVEIMEKMADLFHIGRVGINPDEISGAEEHLTKLKKRKKKVIAQLFRVHLFEPKQIGEAATRLRDLGADIVYLADNFGSLVPEEVRRYVEAAGEKSGLPVGFSARNNSGYATVNSLAAVEAGATWLDVSLSGMGEGAGVANSEILVSILQAKNFVSTINLHQLAITNQRHVLKALHSYPHASIVDLLYAKYKIDFYPRYILERIAEILELSFEALLADIRKRIQFTQLREKNLREYLALEGLSYDVILEFIRTGKVPGLDSEEAG